MGEPWVYGCAYCHKVIGTMDSGAPVSVPYYGREKIAVGMRHFCSLEHADKYDKEGPLPEKE